MFKKKKKSLLETAKDLRLTSASAGQRPQTQPKTQWKC